MTKNQLITLLLCLVIALASCRVKQPPVGVPVKTITEIRERLVEIPAVQDSSDIQALFACDSNNQVILKSYNSLYSDYMNVISTVKPVNGGMGLNIKTKTSHPATVAKVRDSLVYKEIPVFMPGAPYPVEKPLSWLQKTLIYAGAGSCLTLLIFLVKRFSNPFKL
jgi:hypothetical protein